MRVHGDAPAAVIDLDHVRFAGRRRFVGVAAVVRKVISDVDHAAGGNGQNRGPNPHGEVPRVEFVMRRWTVVALVDPPALARRPRQVKTRQAAIDLLCRCIGHGGLKQRTRARRVVPIAEMADRRNQTTGPYCQKRCRAPSFRTVEELPHAHLLSGFSLAGAAHAEARRPGPSGHPVARTRPPRPYSTRLGKQATSFPTATAAGSMAMRKTLGSGAHKKRGAGTGGSGIPGESQHRPHFSPPRSKTDRRGDKIHIAQFPFPRHGVNSRFAEADSRVLIAARWKKTATHHVGSTPA